MFVLLGSEAGGTSQANHATNTGAPADQSELVDALQDQVRYLREQLDAERAARTEERRRHDTIVAQLTNRIPAIEAPSEADERDSEATETVEQVSERAEPQSAIDPGSPRSYPLYMFLSVIGVGSVPLLSDVLSQMEGLSPWANLPFVLFVLPFLFGLYSGVWTRRLQEINRGREAGRGPYPDALLEHRSAVGTQLLRGFLTAVGAAFVALLEIGFALLETGFAISLPVQEILTKILTIVLWVFIGTVLFYVFALLIGLGIGGSHVRRGTSRSDARGSPLASATWWNPQLIVGLLGSIIAAAATVYAAFIGG